MWKEYKEEQQNIEVPTSLKIKTLEKMNATNNKKSFFFRWQVVVGFCSIVVVSIIGYQSLVPTNSNPTFVADETLEEVTLGQDTLEFKETQSMDYYFAGTNTNRTKVTLEKFEKETNTKIPKIVFSGFEMETASWYLDDQGEGTAFYSFVKDKQKINITLTSNVVKIKSDSTLDGKNVMIHYQEVLSKTTYTGLVSSDTFSYQITTQGSSQENFVKYLKTLIKLL